MTITTLLKSNQIPAPLSPTTISGVGNGASGPFALGMTAGVSNLLNQLVSKVQTLSQSGACGYGIAFGLDLSGGAGLTLNCSPGTALVGDVVTQSSAISAVLPDGLSSFIWMTGTGALAWNQDHTQPPTGGVVFLGTVTTSAGLIAAIDYSGRVTTSDGMRFRSTGDSFAPVDQLPSNSRVFTKTQIGTYFWDGTAHQAVVSASNQHLISSRQTTLNADKSLLISDANLQWFTASGASRNVSLPDPSLTPIGLRFTIVNAGDATISTQNYNLILKDFAGNSLATIPPGNQVQAQISTPKSGYSSTWPITLTPIQI